MNEVKVLRLRNGELLIATVRQDEYTPSKKCWLDDPIAAVAIPVVHGDLQGETFVLKPWMGISSDTSFLLSIEEILTMGNLKDSLMEQYANYVAKEEAPQAEEPEELDELDMLQSRILRSRGLLN